MFTLHNVEKCPSDAYNSRRRKKKYLIKTWNDVLLCFGLDFKWENLMFESYGASVATVFN
jgi:hypothetical protein